MEVRNRMSLWKKLYVENAFKYHDWDLQLCKIRRKITCIRFTCTRFDVRKINYSYNLYKIDMNTNHIFSEKLFYCKTRVFYFVVFNGDELLSLCTHLETSQHLPTLSSKLYFSNRSLQYTYAFTSSNLTSFWRNERKLLLLPLL